MKGRFPTKNKLREVKLYNSHDLCSLLPQPKVFISFRPQVNGRGYQCAAYQVVRIGYSTNAKGHWRDYGHKTFDIVFEMTKDRALEAAIEWANARYGMRTWVRDPFGDYQDACVIDLALNACEQAKI